MLPLQKLGLELEVEAEGRRSWQEIEGWVLKDDHSLRNGKEYVTRGTVNPQGVESAISTATTALVEMGAVTSIRTGFHLHLDVTDLDVSELVAFLCIYMVLEDAIFRYAGREREALLFCQRMTDVPYMLEKMRGIAGCQDKDAFLSMLPTENLRYCGLNMHPLCTFGTVEFRQLPMSLNPNYILDFIEVVILMKLECYGKTGMQVVEEFSQDPSGWFFRVLGDKAGFAKDSNYSQGVSLAACLVSEQPSYTNTLDDNWFPVVSESVTRWLASPARKI